MKRKEIFGNLAILIMAGMVGMIALAGVAGATDGVHNINSGLNYTTIQAAIDNASAGDKIHVDSGTYYENVLVNKQLILKGVDTGAGKPIVNASGTESAITLTADGTRLEEFIATGSGQRDISNYGDAGIKVYGSNKTLLNNNLKLNRHGILLISSNSTLIGNNVFNNAFGVYIKNGNNNFLEDNNVSNNTYSGVVLDNSGNNRLENNIVNSNFNDGISISDQSNNNELKANNISKNNHGITLSGSYNQFIGNSLNWNVNDGFFISGYNNIIRENNISFSYWNIYTQGANNKVYHNNFVNISSGGAFDVHGMDIWNDSYPSGGNYWSSYMGIDSNNDGIGDIPYSIPCTGLFCSGRTPQDKYPLMTPYTGQVTPTPTPIPSSPTDLKQLKPDGTTSISIGGTTNERTTIFQGKVISPNGLQVRLEVELRGLNENNGQFNESLGGLKESSLVANGSIATATAVELINGDYHWRARTVDEYGNKSEWYDYGGNPVSEADFTVSVPEFQNFSLAVIADPHLGYYVLPSGDFGYTPGMEKSVTSFTDKLQEIKGQNVEQIAVPGDLVQHRKPEFFTAFKNLVRGFNVNATPGNHDRRQLLWGNDSTNYQNIINPKLDWNFSYKGINIIGLNSGADYNIQEIPESPAVAALMLYLGMTPESDGLTDSQWNKLNNGEFSQAGQRQIIVMHSPVMNINNDTYAGDQVLPVPLDGGPGGNNEAIAHHRADVINYTVNNLVELVLSGHTHKNAIFNATGDQVENTTSDRPLFIQTSNEGYRIVEVKDGKANPFETKIPGVKNRKSSTIFVSYANASGPFAQFGLHAFDSQKRHTGPAGLSCSGEFESGIPDSYYTGSNLGVSSVPETLVGYSSGAGIKIEVTEFKVIPIQCPLSGAPGTSAVKSAQSAGNAIFNQTITDQTDTSTTEIAFYNVTLEENSSASVNVTNVTGYKMEVDLTGDGIIDQIVIPDSVFAANNQPQQNISIIPYDGNGTINLSVNAGNITSAGSMNVSMFPEKLFYEFTHGLISLTISDLVNGSTVNITIELPQNLSVNAQFWEYGKTAANNTSRWYRIPFGSNDGDNIITLEIEDGGAGDDDGIKNGAIITTGGPGITSVPGISGRVIDSAGKTGIAGATVSTNISNSTAADSLGFYSLSVPEGEYILTVKLDPVYYVNDTIQVSTIGKAVAEQNIELVKKPTGNITGSVRN